MNTRTPFAFALLALAALESSHALFGQEPVGNRPTQPAPSSTGQVISVNDARIFCIHKVHVAAQSDGIVNELMVDEGARVAAGDTLFVIDDRVAAAQVGVAQKELDAAIKQAEQTADIEYAKAAAEVSDAEYEEIYELYNKTSATYSEARRKLLEKNRARLGIDVAQVKHETDVLAAEVAREKLKSAQVQLDLFRVAAPYDGVIVERIRDQGEWVKAGEPILQLFHMNQMKVEAFIPVENIAVANLQGAPVKITVRLNPQQVATFNSQIEFVSPLIEGSRVRVSTRIQNEMIGNAWLLRDGMVASAEITMPAMNSTAVMPSHVQPVSAVR